MSDASNTHIIIGCGGTGAKTARKIAGMMNLHPYWRDRMYHSVFFLLVDTDLREMHNLAEEIRDDSPPDTYVGVLNTTRGFDNARQLVQELQDAIGNSEKPIEALERVSRHWWLKQPLAAKNSAQPLFEPDLKNLMDGAGQVPMVSHLATWLAMKGNSRNNSSLEGALDDLLTIVGDRAALKPGDPLRQFNILFTGSLAGGTGRGCAALISLKLREMLYKAFSSVATVKGIFLNEDCFKSTQDTEMKRLAQMINAMSGWSELSGWIEVSRQQPQPPVRFALPGMQGPEQESNDVLGSDAGQPQPLPFDSLGVICSQAATGFTTDHKVLYDVVAASTYLEITTREIKSKVSNEEHRYFSVGSSIIEVNVQPIEDFFRDKAQLDATTRLQKGLDEKDVPKEVARICSFVGFGGSALEELLKLTNDEPKTLMHKLCRELNGENGLLAGRTLPLKQLLADQDVEGARSEIERILSNDVLVELSQEMSRRYLRLLCSEVGVQDGDGAIARTLELLTGAKGAGLEQEASVLHAHQSAGAVGQVAEKVARTLQDMFESPEGIFSDVTIQKWKQKQNVPNPIEVFDRVSKRGGIFGLGKRFEPAEIDELWEAVQAELACQCARALGRGLCTATPSAAEGLGLLRHLRNELMKIKSRSDQIVSAASKASTSRLKITYSDLEERKKELFCSNRLESSIPADGTDFMTRRSIRPPVPDESELKLESRKLMQTVSSLYAGEDDAADRDPEDLRARMVSRLADAIRASQYEVNAGAEYDESERDVDGESIPIVQAFTLPRVFRRLTRQWPRYLNKLKIDDPEQFKKVRLQIQRFYGVDLVVDRDSVSFEDESLVKVDETDFLMLGVATVAARTCSPFWHTRTSARTARNVIVQVPLRLDEDTEKSWEQHLKSQANLNGGTADILASGKSRKDNSRFNPFTMIVHASSEVNSLHDVTSLDAWQVEPRVRKALALAESMEGFDDYQDKVQRLWSTYRGSGFIDPAYITIKELAKARWRPWHVEASKSESDRIVLALLYAWTGPEWFLRQRSPGMALGEAKLRPLFKFGPRVSIAIARPPVLFAKTYKRTNPLDFPTTASSRGGEMAGENMEIAESLNGVLDLLGPDGTPTTEFRAFRDAVLDEYKSFWDVVAVEAEFHPERAPENYLHMIDAWARYVDERKSGGRFNDAEHPLVGDLTELDRIWSKDSSKGFWTAARSALDSVLNDIRRS